MPRSIRDVILDVYDYVDFMSLHELVDQMRSNGYREEEVRESFQELAEKRILYDRGDGLYRRDRRRRV